VQDVRSRAFARNPIKGRQQPHGNNDQDFAEAVSGETGC
jgi:hypothetical protein